MQHALLDCAIVSMADTTGVSGRITAESVKHGLYAKKQSSLWDICGLTIFGCVVSVSLLAALSPTPGQAQSTPAAAGGVPEDSLRHEGRELGIRIGSAVQDAALRTDATYAHILGEHFSSITPENEMKWASVEPTQGLLDFGPADDEVQFARQHRQRVRGFTLVWDSQLPNCQVASALHATATSDCHHIGG